MTTNFDDGIRTSRMQIPRTRGAFSGFVLIVLGAWAGLVPFIGPYFGFGFVPDPGVAWHWTAARGWLEVLPGAAAFLGGLILLVSAHRLMATIGGWLAAAGGVWLVVGPALANQVSLAVGAPDPAANAAVQTLEQLFYFYAVGAGIVFFASFALGRLSVHGVRDVQIAQRRAAAEEERLAEERRIADERRAAEDQQADEERQAAERAQAERAQAEQAQAGRAQAEPTAMGPSGPRHGRPSGEQPTYPQQPAPQNDGQHTAVYPTQQR